MMPKVGFKYRIGGIRGWIMTCKSVKGHDAVLVDGASSFYFHLGDCSLIPYQEVHFEQLRLF